MKTYLAVDISTYQGRISLGTVTDNGVELKTIKQFDVTPVSVLGGIYWNVLSFYVEIIESLRTLANEGITPASIGINTFGMDFCCFGVDGQLLSPAYSYKQQINKDTAQRLSSRLPLKKVYAICGMQPQLFATLYRLDALRQEGNTSLSVTDKVLFIADTLAYMLTGEIVVNSTDACAGMLTNANNGALDANLLAHVGLNTKRFGTYVEPGMTIGSLTEEVRRITGIGEIPVVAVASYGIASSVVSVPSTKPNFAYIVSSDISASGMEIDSPITTEIAEQLGVSNQLGANGKICLQSLVGGSQLVWNVIKELKITHDEAMQAAANAKGTDSIIDIDSSDFLYPVSTIKAIELFCKKTSQPIPTEIGDVFKCIIDSIANRYYEIITAVSKLKGETPNEIFLVGAQADNQVFKQTVANTIGLPIISGAKESASIGNIMVQAVAQGEFKDIWQIRERQSKSAVITVTNPKVQ